jgi:DNA-binding transcriptional MerR regulator
MKSFTPRQITSERRKIILWLKANGYSYDKIGKILGISRQRCHQIFLFDNKNGKTNPVNKSLLTNSEK